METLLMRKFPMKALHHRETDVPECGTQGNVEHERMLFMLAEETNMSGRRVNSVLIHGGSTVSLHGGVCKGNGWGRDFLNSTHRNVVGQEMAFP